MQHACKLIHTYSDILSRIFDFTPHDDGHAIKLSRAAIVAQEISKKYEQRDWILIKGDDMWTRIHHLIADSVEAPGSTWVRNAGLEEAWVVSTPFCMWPVFQQTLTCCVGCAREIEAVMLSACVNLYWSVCRVTKVVSLSLLLFENDVLERCVSTGSKV